MLPSSVTLAPHDEFFRGIAATSGRVHVFEADPGLLEGLGEQTRAILARRVRVPRVCLPPGPGAPRVPRSAKGEVLGLLVLSGLLERTADVEERCAPELLGPGDLLRPWDVPAASAGRSSWYVHERAELAVLDDHFNVVACRSPRVVANLLSRSVQRSHGLVVRLAIGQVRSAEDRILLLLAGVAERWGRPHADGVRIPFALRQDTIARLACMRRPTASTALTALQRSGHLLRCEDRSWVLVGSASTAAGGAAGVAA